LKDSFLRGSPNGNDYNNNKYTSDISINASTRYDTDHDNNYRMSTMST